MAGALAIVAAQFLAITWHNIVEIGWHTIMEIQWHSIQEITWHTMVEIRHYANPVEKMQLMEQTYSCSNTGVDQ